jgi:hypothetical protein
MFSKIKHNFPGIAAVVEAHVPLAKNLLRKLNNVHLFSAYSSAAIAAIL